MKRIQQLSTAIFFALILIALNTSGQLNLTYTTSSHNGFSISCFGGRDGSIDLTVTGGSGQYKYQWSNDSQTEDIQGLAAGYYHCTVQDMGNGQNGDFEVTLTQPEQLGLPDPIISHYGNYGISLYGACNGSIQINPTGGATPYTYLWGDQNTSHNRWSLCTGQYSVSVTDANGCRFQSEHFNITEPPPIEWSMGGNSNVTSSQYIGTSDNSDIVFKTNNTERLRIIGNGTIVTSSDLKIAAASSYNYSTVYVDNTGVLKKSGNPTNTCYQAVPDIWYFNNCNATSDVFLRSPFTRVGIGNDAPQANLDVTGNIRSGSLSGTSGFNIVNIGTNGILTSLHPPTTNANQYVLYGNGTWGQSAWVLNGSNIYNAANTNVGIGTQTPHDNLDIGNLFTLHHDAVNNWIGYNYYYPGQDKRISAGNSSRITLGDGGTISFQTAGNGSAASNITWNDGILIKNDGKVGIGTFTSSVWDGTYRLYVKDGIRTEKIKIDLPASNGWADYVFDGNYKLRTIGELADFINTNKHLPEIPSSKEVMKDGIDLAEMNTKLLAKIEELTLYIIELNKKMDTIEKK